MRFIILGVLGMVSLFAVQQNADISGGQYMSVTLPSAPPYGPTIAQFNIQFRIQGCSGTSGSDRFILGGNNIIIKIPAGTTTVSAVDAHSAVTSADYSTNAQPGDFRVALSFDSIGGQLTMKTWSGDGSTPSTVVAGDTTAAMNFEGQTLYIGSQFGALPLNCTPTFWRMDTGLYTSSTPPADIPTAPAGLLDYLFDGNLNDRSGNGQTLSLSSGSLTFPSTTNYDCIESFGGYGQQRTFSTTSGEALILNSNSFCSRNGTGVPTTTTWSNPSGMPAAGSFSSTSTPTTNFTSTTAGTYTIELLVTDGVTSPNSTQTFGGVKTLAGNVIDLSGLDSRLAYLIGPVLEFGHNSFPWEDFGEMADADQLYATMTTTFNVVTDGTSLTGAPFSVTSAHPYHVTSASSWTGQVAMGQQIMVTWLTVDGANTGRSVCTIASVNSTTDVTCTDNNFPPTANGLVALPTTANAFLVKPDAGCSPALSLNCYVGSYWGLEAGVGTTNWNYYDRVASWYRLWARTGIDTYLTQARALADYWWTYGLDHGTGNVMYAGGIARAYSLVGFYMRAIDGQTGRMVPIRPWVESFIANQTNLFNTIADPGSDKRAMGYNYGFNGVAAIVDSGIRSTVCPLLAARVSDWASVQGTTAFGFLPDDLFAQNASFTNVNLGASVFREGITDVGLEYGYDALVNPAVCNDPTDAATLLNVIKTSANFIWNYGRSTNNRGIWGAGINYLTDVSGTQTTQPGTISVAIGSTSVTGVSTTFISGGGGLCDGNHYLAPYNDLMTGAGTGGGDGFRNHTYITKVASCGSDTSLTLATTFSPVQSVAGSVPINLAGVRFAIASLATTTNCPAVLSVPNCQNANGSGFTPPDGDRGLTRTVTGLFGWLYERTGILAYLQHGQEFYSATYGGPANGPGGSQPCAGSGCDGIMAETASALEDCNTFGFPPACYFNGSPFISNGMKNWNEGAGFANSDRIPADSALLGVLIPSPGNRGKSRFNGKTVFR